MHRRDPRRLPVRRPVAPVAAGAPEVFAPIALDPAVAKHLKEVKYNGDSPLAGRVNEVVDWKKWSMERRIAFLRAFVQDTARDPAIVAKAAAIMNASGAGSRDHKAQWAALLAYVQPDGASGMRYANERDERFQSPQYTLTCKVGDCDDAAILLAALGDSHRLPWRFVISGRRTDGKKVMWIEGAGAVPRGVQWTHIFLQVGGPPFRPTWWLFAEPTLRVPLGWDCVSGTAPAGRSDLAGADVGTALGDASASPSPASSSATSSASGGLSRATEFARKLPWGQVVAGTLTSVLSFYLTKQLLRERRRRRS